MVTKVEVVWRDKLGLLRRKWGRSPRAWDGATCREYCLGPK